MGSEKENLGFCIMKYYLKLTASSASLYVPNLKCSPSISGIVN